MIENKNFQKIYDVLKSQFDIGTLEQFREKMNDANNRRRVYETLGTAYDVGTYEEFENKIGRQQEETNETPYRRFELNDVVDTPLEKVEYYNPFEKEAYQFSKTINKNVFKTPTITQIKRLKDGNFLETTDNEGNTIRESHRMVADIDPVSKKPVVFPTLYPKVENPTKNPEDWISFDNNEEAIQYAKDNDELYFGLNTSTGDIPFINLKEANEYATNGYKKLQTWKEHYDGLLNYMEKNPNITTEMRKATERGIIRRQKLNAVKEEALKNYREGNFDNTIVKVGGLLKDAVVHDLFFNSIGSLAADIENFIGGTDNIFSFLDNVAETKEQKDLVKFYTEAYKRKGVIPDAEVEKLLKDGIVNNIANGIDDVINKGDFGTLTLGFNALGTQTLRAIPTAVAIMYTGGRVGSSRFLKGLSSSNRLRAGTLISATPYGYSHSVLDEYRQDKNVSGGDRLESFARGLIEGLTEIMGVTVNKAFTKTITKKQRQDLVDAYLKPMRVNVGRAAGEEGLEEYIASIGNGLVDIVADGADPFKTLQKRHREGLDQFFVGVGAGTLISGGARLLSNRTDMFDNQDLMQELDFINDAINDETLSETSKNKLRERKKKITIDYIDRLSKKLVDFNSLEQKDIDKALDKAEELKELMVYTSELNEIKKRTGKKSFDKTIKTNNEKITRLRKEIDEITSKGAAAKVQKTIDEKTETPAVVNEQVEKEKEVAEISFDANTANEASEYVKETGFGNLLDGISNLLKATKELTAKDLPFKINFYNSNKNFASVSSKKVTEKTAAKIGGRYDEITNTAHINLEALRDLDPTQAKVTLLHEVIHPIVEEVIAANTTGLKTMAEFALKDKGIAEFVKGLKTKNQQTLDKEAVTEYLARVASGDIQPTLTTIESFKQSVINALDSIGIKLPQSLDFQIDTEQDFKNFASRLANTLKSGRVVRAGVRAPEGQEKKSGPESMRIVTDGNIEFEDGGKKVEKFFDEKRLDKTQEDDKLRDLTNSEDFKKWFAGSKITDKNGNPLVLYHGSTADWYKYDITKAGNTGLDYFGPGIYTTPDTRIANIFAGEREGETGGSVYPLYVSVKNPIIVESSNTPETKFTEEQIDSLINNSPNLEATIDNQVEFVNFIKDAIQQEFNEGARMSREQQAIKNDLLQNANSINNMYNDFQNTDKTDADYGSAMQSYTPDIISFYQNLSNATLETGLPEIDNIANNAVEFMKRIDFGFYRTPSKLEKDVDGSYTLKPSVSFGKKENTESIKRFHKALNDIGYDGILADEILKSDGTVKDFRVVVAFSPNQIKSIYNTGKFNLASDNILNRELAKPTEQKETKKEETPPIVTQPEEVDEMFRILTEKQTKAFYHRSLKYRKNAPVVPGSWASAFNIQRGLIEKYVRKTAAVKFGEFTEDIEILARYNLYKSSKKTAEDFHKAVMPLIENTVPSIEDLQRAKKLADELNKRFNLDDVFINEIGTYVSMLDSDLLKDIKTDEDIVALVEEIQMEELNEEEKKRITALTDDIIKRGNDLHKKNEEKQLDAKYELKAIKSFIVRQAEKIIKAKAKTEAALKKYVLTDKDIESIDRALAGSTMPVEDKAKVIGNLKNNRKLIGNVAKNQIRKSNNIQKIDSLLKKSRKQILDYLLNRNSILGFNVTSNEINTIDDALPKNGFSKTHIQVLEDTFENHEIDKLLNTLESLADGYMSPATYSRILKKLANTVKAIDFVNNLSELKLLKDDLGRFIRDPKARREYREKPNLGWIRDAVDKRAVKKELESVMSNSAFPVFGKIKNKAVIILFNIIRLNQGTAEGYKKKINIQKTNLVNKIKFSTEFEGEAYTIRDLNILGHMYMLHKQFLNNPNSSRVPELYQSLIKTRLEDNDEDSKQIMRVWNNFKKENANVLDVAKADKLFKKSNFADYLKFARKTFDDLQDKVAYLQKFRIRDKIQIFADYVPVLNTKQSGNDALAKSFNAIISSVFNPAAVTPAKTTISRQTYKNNDGDFTTPRGAKSHFDLDKAISFAVHETIDDYYIKEGLKDVGMILNMAIKLGDTKTRDILKLFENTIKQKVENNYNYVRDNSTIERSIATLANNLSLSLLANVRRLVEIGANTILLFGSQVTNMSFTKNGINSMRASYDVAYEVSKVFGSAFRERFVRGGLSYYDLERIGQSPLEKTIRDKFAGSEFLAQGIFEANKVTSNVVGYAQGLVRLPDVYLTQLVWGRVFENEYKKLTNQDFDLNNIKDKTWMLNNRDKVLEAINNADINISRVMPAVKFDQDIPTGSRKGLSATIFNLFSTFRKTLSNTFVNSWNSLLGLKGGDLTKKEAAATLTAGAGSIMFYSVVSAQVMSVVGSLFMEWMGADDDDEKRKEKERVAWTNGLVEIILFNTSIGKWNSFGYAAASSYLRNMGRQYVTQEPESAKELFSIANKTYLTNMTYAPSYASTIHPIFQYPFSVADAIKAYEKASDEDKDVAFTNAVLTLGQGMGVPHSSDLKILVGSYLKNNAGVAKNYNYGPYKRDVNKNNNKRKVNKR